jgi:opacity protein-like surface antigen
MKMQFVVTPFIIAGAALLLAPAVWAQDVPGFSLGGFYEYRVENEIGNDDLAFNYYGARLAFRDERWVEFFIDGGGEEISFDPVKDETAACFGLGGSFWLTRGDPGWGPLDIGIFGAGYFADYSGVEFKDLGLESDLKHFRGLGQLVVRWYVNQDFKAYVKGGVQYSKLDPSEDGIEDYYDDLDKVTPAVNAGVELQLVENLIAILELNYSESVGGAVRLGYWF